MENVGYAYKDKITVVRIMSSMPPSGKEDGDCAPSPANPHDRPGYRLCSYVADFIQSNAGPVPQVKTRLERKDLMAAGRVRCGIGRHRYTVVPGLYATGNPDENAEVLVTANFKLTFDHLRKSLGNTDAWLLVLDTRGVNVWCAAGKGTFSSKELVHRIQQTHLEQVVAHRRLIVPQLGATGVRAAAVKKATGFRVVFGPIRARDIPRFLANHRTADPAMRQVTFTLYERLILTPVECRSALKPALPIILFLFILSGLGPGLFSLASAWTRGLTAVGALATGMVTGAVLTPVLLPLIPVRAFALKGILAGSGAALLFLRSVPPATASLPMALSLFLMVVATSSFLAMNFTGATPFTAPSGVEKEMKQYIPVQLISLIAATGFWIYAAFT